MVLVVRAAVASCAVLFCAHPLPRTRCRVPAIVSLMTDDELLALTTDNVRDTPPDKVEELVEELEALAANEMDAKGKIDLQLSRLLAVAHTRTGDHENAA